MWGTVTSFATNLCVVKCRTYMDESQSCMPTQPVRTQPQWRWMTYQRQPSWLTAKLSKTIAKLCCKPQRKQATSSSGLRPKLIKLLKEPSCKLVGPRGKHLNLYINHGNLDFFEVNIISEILKGQFFCQYGYLTFLNSFDFKVHTCSAPQELKK